jgi:hypothetical protein
MTGAAYADLVAFYLSRRFQDRGLKVYREIQIGKTIIGKNRHVDILCVCEHESCVRDRCSSDSMGIC